MSEEHGYQRSGKKCREKFENLYKYYKKTKEGKAGRQDGKHYRFFRQLEALYGETSNNNNASASASENHHHHVRYNNAANHISHIQEGGVGVPFQTQKSSDNTNNNNSLSLSNNNSSEFDSTSSEDSDLNDSVEKRRKRKGKRSWKAKIKDFIDSQMRKLMEKQEVWLEKIINTIEQKEQERVLREEEWRKQEAARVDREHKFWANERSWIESRDAAMMEALRTLSSGKEVMKSALLLPNDEQENVVAELQSMTKNQNDNGSHETINSIIRGDGWPECEITRLIQLRTSMEGRFHQLGCPEEILWEEIATKMACFGYDRTPLMCKEKWDSISSYLIKCSKKRKENSRFGCYLANESVTSHAIDQGILDHQAIRQAQNNDQVANSSPPNHDSGNNVIHDGSSYRFVMDAENLWENYGVKFNKGNN
ncbi:OLC1v1034304C1 [Oldenlandia corymbosa var. corymbosa]|nr:OLC1v1034304C1 [Oldenlandia corymbosa var. corymbosa]